MSDLKTAMKYDGDKPRPELIDPLFTIGVARVLAFGARKYADWNWAKGFKWLRVCGSLTRHLLLFMAGQDNDRESGLPHVDHIGCNAMFLSAHFYRGLGADDRFKALESLLTTMEGGLSESVTAPAETKLTIQQMVNLKNGSIEDD